MLLAEFRNKLAFGQDLGAALVRGLRESAFLVYLATSLFFLIALITFNVEDPGWSHGGAGRAVANGGGSVGAWLADLFLSIFGVTAFLFPFLLSGYGYSIFQHRDDDGGNLIDTLLRWIGFVTAMASGAALADLHIIRPPVALPENGSSGGILGRETADLLTGSFGHPGGSVLLAALFLAGVSLFTGLSWLSVIDGVGRVGLPILNGFSWLFRLAGGRSPAVPVAAGFAREAPPVEDPPRPRRLEPGVRKKNLPEDTAAPKKAPAPVNVVSGPKPAKAAADLPPLNPGELPPLSLLNDKAPRIRGYSHAQLEDMSRQLESILDDFGVEVQVTEVHPGPVITRFEVQPAPGVKVSRISGLAKDLARTLSVTSVRVVEIIPGKTVIGIEIPNEEREIVLLYLVLAS